MTTEFDRLRPIEFPPFTNLEGWEDGFTLKVDGIPVDFTESGIELTVTLWSRLPRTKMLTADQDEPILTLSNGRVDWVFPESLTASLKPGTHDIGVLLKRPDDIRRQLFIGFVKVKQGL